MAGIGPLISILKFLKLFYNTEKEDKVGNYVDRAKKVERARGQSGQIAHFRRKG